MKTIEELLGKPPHYEGDILKMNIDDEYFNWYISSVSPHVPLKTRKIYVYNNTYVLHRLNILNGLREAKDHLIAQKEVQTKLNNLNLLYVIDGNDSILDKLIEAIREFKTKRIDSLDDRLNCVDSLIKFYTNINIILI